MPPKTRNRFPALTNRIVGRTQEGRNIYENELDADGKTSVSSERSVSFEIDGKHFNYPTIFGGIELSPDQAYDKFIENQGVDPETGKKATAFATMEDAVKAAKSRSKQLGNIQ